MKFRRLPPLSFLKFLTLANFVFWLAFAVVFALKSRPYQPTKPVFEERSPEFVYFGRALSAFEHEQLIPIIKISSAVQHLSFYVARPFFVYFNRRGITVDHLYGRVSVGGYYLILVCVVSFLQWSLIGFGIDYIRHRTTATVTQ